MYPDIAMYLSLQKAHGVIKHGAAEAVKGTGSTLFTLAGAVALGFGVPLLWIFLASAIAGGDRNVTSSLVVFTATGVIGTYWVLLVVAAWARASLLDREGGRSVRRQSWNRSMRDEPFRPGRGRSDPIERIFVIAAILGFIAFEVWFALFAGSPFGSYPG
jgi:hypothetical protein